MRCSHNRSAASSSASYAGQVEWLYEKCFDRKGQSDRVMICDIYLNLGGCGRCVLITVVDSEGWDVIGRSGAGMGLNERLNEQLNKRLNER